MKLSSLVLLLFSLFTLSNPWSVNAKTHGSASDTPAAQRSTIYDAVMALQLRLAVYPNAQAKAGLSIDSADMESVLQFMAAFLRYSIILQNSGLSRHAQHMDDFAAAPFLKPSTTSNSIAFTAADPAADDAEYAAIIQDCNALGIHIVTFAKPGAEDRKHAFLRHAGKTATFRFILTDLAFALDMSLTLLCEPALMQQSGNIQGVKRAAFKAYASILAQSALGYDAVVSPPRNARQRKAVRQVMALAQAEIDQSRNALAALAQDQTTSQAVRNLARFVRKALEEYGAEQRKARTSIQGQP